MKPLYEPGLEFYIEKIQRGEPFSFVRYGNGEWDCILNLYHRTRSGSQRFTPDLRKALITSLIEKYEGTYYLAIPPSHLLVQLNLLSQIEQWLVKNTLDLTWHSDRIFLEMSICGELYPLVDILKSQHTIVVGPPWLKQLPFASDFISVNPKDCWTQVDSIEEQLHKFNNVVISFSAGPTAKVLIHRLAPILSQHSWLIDFGSLWDPYCGVKSRKYHRVLSAKTMRRNLGV